MIIIECLHLQVVAEFLPYLSYDDIKKSTLVCRLWAEEGTKILAAKGQFHLNDHEGVRSFLDHLKNSKSPSKLGSIKKLRLRLSAGEPAEDSETLIESVVCNELMKEIGKKLQSLVLQTHVWRSNSKILYKFLYSDVPNLECLKLFMTHRQEDLPARPDFNRLVKTIEESSRKLLPSIRNLTVVYEDEQIVAHGHNLVADLFSRMPNLKKFTCDGDKNLREEIIWQFIGIRGFHKFNPSFSEFDFNLNLNEDEVKRFHETLKYPLETLKLSLRPGLRFPALYSFLSSLGSTLTNLQLDFIFIPLNPERFPCGQHLVNLKNLTLKNYNGPLNFLHFTEKLLTLCLNNVNLSVAFREEEEEFYSDIPHGLKSLEVFDGHSNAGRFSFPHIFRKIVKLFPTLKKFRMDYLTDANIKIIAEGLPYLEELILENSVCTDEGVTGFSPSSLKYIPTSATKVRFDEQKRLPCIVSLKRTF